MVNDSRIPFFATIIGGILLAFWPLAIGSYGLSLSIGLLSFGVLATAWGMFSGPTRYVSLASVAFFGVGAYTVAVLGESMPWWAVLVVSAVIGALLALVVGLATLRLAGVYFVIFTFGLTEMIRQLVTWYEVNVTQSIGRYIFLDVSQRAIYWQLLALLVVLLLAGLLIGRSRIGFALRVIGGDEVVARHFGVNTTAVKLWLFVISSVFMSLTGAIMAPRWTYIDPAIAFNATLSFQVVIMALLGGMHRLYGPLLGVVPLTLLFEYLGANFPNAFSILLGLVFIMIVYLVPNGIVGVVEKYARRRKPAPVIAEPAGERA
ncbi:MAG TPA: branched-chain amino acid ABC transporter permease [Xanthobacteraceae bacterium]|nr:branched-chain amino acid ABC transporter permease [Xanthobacteraceae bacterium]